MEGIMVSAATGVMNSLLAKLTTLLGEEYKLQKKVKRDVAFLKDELSSMNALLEKLADTEALDPQHKEWRNQVREMAYDIEDCIDDYMHRLHQDSDKSKGIKRFFSGAIKEVKKLAACHGFSEQIRELKTRIVEASQRRDRYRLDAVLDSGSNEVVPIDPRLPALYAEASSLIGIDAPREELIKLVDDGETSLKVVSIVGIGGLGKTTLANQVYQKVGEQFDCRAFVSVSQKPDTRKILRSILSQIRKQEYERTESGDEECLINALRDFLKDKSSKTPEISTSIKHKIFKTLLPLTKITIVAEVNQVTRSNVRSYSVCCWLQICQHFLPDALSGLETLSCLFVQQECSIFLLL